jgi:hypothetical protein
MASVIRLHKAKTLKKAEEEQAGNKSTSQALLERMFKGQ